MKKSTLQFLGVVLLLAIAMCYSGQAQASNLYPTIDQVYHHDSWPGGHWNYWDTTPNPNVEVYYYSYDPGFGSSSGSYYTNLQYDISSLWTGPTITSVKLHLDLLSVSGDSNAQVTISGLADNLLTRPLGWNSFDVTSLLVSGSSTITFNTGFSDPDHAGVDVAFGSPASGQSPYLEIDTVSTSAVPEPTTLLLLGLGLLGLAGFRKMLK